MKRLILVILLASTGAIGIGAFLFLREFHLSFPELPTGLYAGVMQFDDNGPTIPWVIDRSEAAKDPAIFVADPDIPAQRAPIFGGSGRDRLPLIISGPSSRFRFVGGEAGEGVFEGHFLNPITNKQGHWHIELISLPELSKAAADDLEEWALLWTELLTTEARIENSERKVDEQKSKIEKLNRYLVDEDSLKKKADSRLGETTGALETARAQLATVRVELDAATRRVEISQRVSARGRLALLARESLQREARWVDLTLKVLAPETAPGFEQSLDRAQRVRKLKDDIAAENRRIADLQDVGRYRGTNAETKTEEEFYREIQQ